MNKVIHLLFIFLLMISVFSCTTENAGITKEASIKLKDIAADLTGKWVNVSKNETIIETWTKVNDSLFNATTCIVTGTDTFYIENIRLEQNGNEIFYIPQVSNHNGGQPITFKMTSGTKNELVFENPEHDFPKRISYLFISKDSLVATVSGTNNGIADTQKFEMSRVK